MVRTPLVFLPWRSLAWRAVDSGKSGTDPVCRSLCIFASPAAARGGETFADGGHSRARRSFTSSSSLIPMPDGLATLHPWQSCDLSPELAAGAGWDGHTATLAA